LNKDKAQALLAGKSTGRQTLHDGASPRLELNKHNAKKHDAI
jgi:hypothetical protein